MKRSRIICSIITVIYIILSVALVLILLKSNFNDESNLSVDLKISHLGIFTACALMYVFVRNKLANKMSNKAASIKISKVYCYIYLAVIVLVSRFIIAYFQKDITIETIVPGFSIGLGSYINYGLGILVRNQMYANIIINCILTFLSCILIKRIVLNITDNDMVATTTSIGYLLAPQSLALVTEYIKYNYNVVITLSTVYFIMHIIDQVKNFGRKNNSYWIYGIVLGVLQSLDIVMGNSYVLWLFTMLLTTSVAMYVDVVHLKLKFKEKLDFKLKRIAEKIEKINISKLLCVSLISLTISGITTIIYSSTIANNFQALNVSNALNILVHSRNYYLVLIIFALVFEIVSVITKRKLDVKMHLIKLMFIITALLTFFTVDGIYAAALFDTLLILNSIMIICNICYNREERIKLLNEKN